MKNAEQKYCQPCPPSQTAAAVLHQSHQQFFISPINSSSSVPSTVLHQSHHQFFISPINSSSSVPSTVLHQSHHQFFMSLIISSSSVSSSVLHQSHHQSMSRRESSWSSYADTATAKRQPSLKRQHLDDQQNVTEVYPCTVESHKTWQDHTILSCLQNNLLSQYNTGSGIR